MTELETARAHLQECQVELKIARGLAWCLGGQRAAKVRERAVLAALAWVWDAQERDLGHQIYLQVKLGIEEMARAFNDGAVEPTRLHIPLPNAIKLGLISAAKARREISGAGLPLADRFYRSPRRPTRKAPAPASRGRRRR